MDKLPRDMNSQKMSNNKLSPPASTRCQQEDHREHNAQLDIRRDKAPPPWRAVNNGDNTPRRLPSAGHNVELPLRQPTSSTFSPQLTGPGFIPSRSKTPTAAQADASRQTVRLPSPTTDQLPLHHPIPQTPIRLEDQKRRWSAQWNQQAQLLGILPMSGPATPTLKEGSEKMVAMLRQLHKRCDGRVAALETKMSQLERSLLERIATLEKREEKARREVERLTGWKAEVESRVQVQVDVVTDVVKRLIATEDMMGELRSQLKREEIDPLPPASREETPLARCFPSPMSISPVGTPDIELPSGDDGLPDYLPSRETSASPYASSGFAATTRSTGKKVTKKRRQCSVVEMPPVAGPGLEVTKLTSAPISKADKSKSPMPEPRVPKPPSSKPMMRPSRPISKTPQCKKPLSELFIPKTTVPRQKVKPEPRLDPIAPITHAVRIPLGNPRDPATTVRTSTLMTTLSSGRQVPIFTFHKHPETVREQWDEYAHGLAGQRSVRWLDEHYTTKWRRDTYARTWYSRRKKFWDVCKGFLKQGLSEDQMVARVVSVMAPSELSVAGFVDWLRHERKGVEHVLRGGGLYFTRHVRVRPTEGMKGVKRKGVESRGSGSDEDLEDETLDVVSESEDEERPHKRRSSLKLRSRAVLAPPPFEESSDDSDSVVGAY